MAADSVMVEREAGSRGRPPVRRAEFDAALRLRIVRGELARGARLPLRRELEREYGVSNDTVQAVMHELERDGFTETRGRAGTFVHTEPPFCWRQALLFPAAPNESFHWTRYHDSLRALAEAPAEEGERATPCYCGVQYGASEDYRRLMEDITRHRLAGLIFASLDIPGNLPGLALRQGLPVVTLATDAPFESAGEAASIEKEAALVMFSLRSFFRQALRRVAERGRRRPALLLTPDMQKKLAPLAAREARSLELEVRPYWMQYGLPFHPELVRGTVHMLMNPDQRERPDALVVADDNLLPFALLGLEDAGLRAGTDIEVVAHANFPLPPAERDERVARLGFDLAAALEQAGLQIERWRESGRRPGTVTIEAEVG